MKKILLFFVAIMAMILVAEAQAPERFSYQSVIRDAAGNLVANEPVGVRVSILQYSPDGSAVYSETHNRATNANGLVTMEIGAGTVVSGSFSNIDWANGPYFLKIETDVNGGTNYTLAGTQQMLSVPYALYAAASGNGEGVSQTDFQALVGRVDSLAQIIANMNGGSGSEGGGDNEGGDDNPDDNNTTITAQACPGVPTVTDIDGNVYNTVQIGDQCWMRENLKTTKYANGTTIPLGTTTSSTTAYRYYPDNDSANVTDYGYLYNWAAVMNGSASSEANPSGVQGICPDGWHVPSDDEWTELTNYVKSQSQYVCGDDTNYIAKALASETGWNSSSLFNCKVGYNPDANNATGFSARPAGYYRGNYGYFGDLAYFWSATQYNSNNAYVRYLYYNDAFVTRGNNSKNHGYSVRCVCNEEGSGSEGSGDNEGGDDNSDDNDTTITAQPCPGVPTVTDVDSNVYNTVQIGEQCWMRENLRTTRYANGTTIPLGTSTSSTTAYRYYPGNDSANVSTYGYLYNWAAVMNGAASSSANPSGVQGICPDGWHVPSDDEWTEMTNYVSSQSQYVCGNNTAYIAKALASETGWISSTDNCDVGNNPSTNNATGFSARPAGDYNGNYGDYANFWSATQYNSSYAYGRDLGCNNAYVYRYISFKYYGYSVRCVRN